MGSPATARPSSGSRGAVPAADLPARWEGEEWLAALEAWLVPALDAVGVRTTGPVVRDRVRFWSVVARVETDAGRVWVKENAPSQAFEAALVGGRRHPGSGCRGHAARDRPRPRVAGDRGPRACRCGTTSRRPRSPTGSRCCRPGRPCSTRSPSTPTPCWPRGFAPSPRQPTTSSPGWRPSSRRRAPCRMPTRAASTTPRPPPWSTVFRASPPRPQRLAASGIPPSLQHNDLHLGNAFRRADGAIAFIDLGDALWTHPLTAARIPLWIMRNRFDARGRRPRGRPGRRRLPRAVDRPLRPLHPARPARRRRAVSCLHRAESWRRLQADVPVTRVDEPFLRSVPEWLVDAAAPDPYASAIAR